MATTFEWKVNRMTVYEQIGGYSNVVNKIYYSCTASDAEISKTLTGICELDLDSTEPFIAYENLTEAEVLNWVWSHGVDQLAIEAELDAAIHQPSLVVLPLPWQ